MPVFSGVGHNSTNKSGALPLICPRPTRSVVLATASTLPVPSADDVALEDAPQPELFTTSAMPRPEDLLTLISFFPYTGVPIAKNTFPLILATLRILARIIRNELSI